MMTNKQTPSNVSVGNTKMQRSLRLFYGQATKGAWWMPWHREAMKDVVSCDKLRLAAKQALTRRFPNGETRQGLCPVIVH
jgi:hypothetical protein